MLSLPLAFSRPLFLNNFAGQILDAGVRLVFAARQLQREKVGLLAPHFARFFRRLPCVMQAVLGTLSMPLQATFDALLNSSFLRYKGPGGLRLATIQSQLPLLQGSRVHRGPATSQHTVEISRNTVAGPRLLHAASRVNEGFHTNPWSGGASLTERDGLPTLSWTLVPELT